MEFISRKPWSGILLALIITSGILSCLHTIREAQRVNGGYGFPLDDPWIHLQFARTLHEYGAFSYYKNEMVTSGSTSPLYTFLLAAGFFVTSNEMILSYVIGMGSLALAAALMYFFARALVPDAPICAFGAALLFVLEPRMHWFALSGMETVFFCSVLVAAMYLYRTKRAVPFGIVSGLLLWARPDAVLFYIAVAVDALNETVLGKSGTETRRGKPSVHSDVLWLKKSAIIAGLTAVCYAGFNLYLSGSLLPNTYAAKLKYYSNPYPAFLHEAYHFLTEGPAVVIAVFSAVGILSLIRSVLRRRSAPMLVPFVWAVLLFLAYWKNLPRLYQNGRYFVPLLPAFLLLGIDGMRIVFGAMRQRIRQISRPAIAAGVLGGAFFFLGAAFGVRALQDEAYYLDTCRYISDRHVRTGKWMHDHLPQDAVIATHDIGAIAYYSGRRVVDMLGLVSPGMIEHIGSIDRLMDFLVRNRSTHIAVLRNWFEITNVRPVFQTDAAHPEIMEVFVFDPGRLHFAPHGATMLNDAAERFLAAGDAGTAVRYLRQSLMMDGGSARTHYLAGVAALRLGNMAAAQEQFRTVRGIEPDYPGLNESAAIAGFPK